MKWRIGDRVLVCGRYAGVIVDFFTYRGRTSYSVLFDDAIFARIPPQTAIGVRAEDLAETVTRAAGAAPCRHPPSSG